MWLWLWSRVVLCGEAQWERFILCGTAPLSYACVCVSCRVRCPVSTSLSRPRCLDLAVSTSLSRPRCLDLAVFPVRRLPQQSHAQALRANLRDSEAQAVAERDDAQAARMEAEHARADLEAARRVTQEVCTKFSAAAKRAVSEQLAARKAVTCLRAGLAAVVKELGGAASPGADANAVAVAGASVGVGADGGDDTAREESGHHERVDTANAVPEALRDEAMRVVATVKSVVRRGRAVAYVCVCCPCCPCCPCFALGGGGGGSVVLSPSMRLGAGVVAPPPLLSFPPLDDQDHPALPFVVRWSHKGWGPPHMVVTPSAALRTPTQPRIRFPPHAPNAQRTAQKEKQREEGWLRVLAAR